MKNSVAVVVAVFAGVMLYFMVEVIDPSHPEDAKKHDKGGTPVLKIHSDVLLTDLPPITYEGHLAWCLRDRKPHFNILHIPKSSGTTVLRNLYTYCKDKPTECTFCCNGHNSLSRLPAMALSRMIHPEHHDRCPQVLMSVRHPVSIVVSAYYESRAWLMAPNTDRPVCNHFECNSGPAFDAMMTENFTLREAIRFDPEPFYVRNKMTIFLTDYYLGSSQYNVRGTQYLKEAALRKLSRHVHFFFISEHLMEGMALFAAHYNISWYRYFNQWDWNPYEKVERSDPLWDEIAHQNSVDVEIYDEIVRIYNRQKIRILRAMWPRVPTMFTCQKKKCTAAPPRCVSECHRTTLWHIPPENVGKPFPAENEVFLLRGETGNDVSA